MFVKPGDIQYPARFIRGGEAFTTLEAPVPAPYFRKTFVMAGAAEGELLITACGFYRLYLNGREYTKGPLAPYISNTDDYIYPSYGNWVKRGATTLREKYPCRGEGKSKGFFLTWKFRRASEPWRKWILPTALKTVRIQKLSLAARI